MAAMEETQRALATLEQVEKVVRREANDDASVRRLAATLEGVRAGLVAALLEAQALRAEPRMLPREDVGGDTACFAHLLCPECGAVLVEGHLASCPSA
jgi:hypothetical protein